MVPLSVLDLAPIVEGGDAADAFRRSLDLAQHAERWATAATGSPSTTACRDRERGHRGRHRPRGRGHVHHPRRRRRDHAAEPRAARDRGAVRHPGLALPGAHRPRTRPGAGVGPAHHSGAATESAGRRHLSRRCRRADGLLPPAPSPAAGSRGARGRARRADLDPGLEPVRRAARGRARACPTPSPRTSRRPR